MTLYDRATGWLDAEMHHAIRELLLHTLARHDLHCAAYCLMPDHAHFLCVNFHPLVEERACLLPD